MFELFWLMVTAALLKQLFACVAAGTLFVLVTAMLVMIAVAEKKK